MKQEAVGSENIKLTALTEILQAISSTLDLKTVMKKILPVLHEHLGMHRGTLTLLNPETNELSIQEAYGLENAEIKRGKYKLGEGVTGKVVATGEPLVVPNIGEEPLFLNRTQAREDRKSTRLNSSHSQISESPL